MRVPPVGELYNTADLKDLVQWVNHHLEPGTPILSDMPTSSALRVASHARIVLNPQYEYTPLRRKTHFFYTLGDCNDARWFGETLRGRYKTDVVIVPMKFCTIPREKGHYGVQRLLSLNPLGTCPSGVPYYRRLCNRLWAGNSLFELLFSNSRYLVFRYKGLSAAAEERPWEVMHQLDHYKPWIEKHAVLDEVLGPRQIVSTARALSTHFNSPVVLPLLRHGLEMFPGNEDMLRMYAETADYDLAMFDEAKKYYEVVFESMGSRCSGPEDLTFYAMYLSHMVETGTGNDSEIMSVIEASIKCLGLTFPRLYAQQLCEHAVVVLKAFKNKPGAPRPSVQRTAVSFFNLSKVSF
ncbi:Q-cell neuroblast polarization [Babesia ovata]|uniref:Q-cell neuroblast polarization n=1 Tax=Babesia ovata TaxID=189622 RepID=A0A2H6KCI1_9APIC|nr:Q-cell neuroblast polarization [Babesia ovata]GBE60687.1 Q-cell neuroblast polarization [Babesia ovata]